MTFIRSARHHLRALIAITLPLLGVASVAQPSLPASAGGVSARPAALADFFRRPAYTEMAVSPNGRYVATTSPVAGRMNLVVIDLDLRKATPVTAFDDIDVGRVVWVGNDRLLFSAVQFNAPSGQDSPRAGGLWTATRDGSHVLQLAKTAWQFDRTGTGGFAALTYLARVSGSDDEIIAAGIVANDDSFDLYRVNLASGRYRLLTQGRPSDRLSRWILDRRQVPRVAIASAQGASTTQIVFYRTDVEAPWKEIARFDSTRSPAFVPIAFDSDDRHLIVASNADRRTMALFRYDPESRRFVEPLAQHPRYDLGATPAGEPLRALVFDPESRELIGIYVDADKPQVVWFDEHMARVQATLDATLPNRTNLIQRSGNSRRFLVNSFSDLEPGRFYIFDEDRRNLEEIGPARPWLQDRLARVRPFILKTRDGLEIPSSYVLPNDYQPGQRLPTIVHVHGGPMARDVVQGGRYGASFGVVEAQVLAARGYAVVLPNFRVTPGLGSDVYYAGFGAYGQKMSDDHEDAAKWAEAQGFADPRRICISGASYGGYAALHAVSRPGHPFACAISGLPVTDLKFQRAEADYAGFPSAVEFWRKLQGVPDFDDPLVRALSPVFNADRIKVPVFMYVGERDRRTPPEQARRMAEALRNSGNPVRDFYIGKGEGHGYGVTAHNVELYDRMLKFLRDAIGP